MILSFSLTLSWSFSLILSLFLFISFSLWLFFYSSTFFLSLFIQFLRELTITGFLRWLLKIFIFRIAWWYFLFLVDLIFGVIRWSETQIINNFRFVFFLSFFNLIDFFCFNNFLLIMSFFLLIFWCKIFQFLSGLFDWSLCPFYVLMLMFLIWRFLFIGDLFWLNLEFRSGQKCR